MFIQMLGQRPPLFDRIGGFAFRHRREILPGAVALTVLLLALSGPFGGKLSAGGFGVPGSQSQRATDLLTQHFGAGNTELILVYRSPHADAASPAVQSEVEASFARLARRPQVTGVLDRADTGQAIFVGGRGHDTFAVVNLRLSETAATSQLPQLESYLNHPPGLQMWVTGAPAIDALYNRALETQLKRAELIALPISLLLLLLVFGSVLAALVPLLIAGLAVPAALALIDLLAARFQMSIFVTNVATIIGLGLAIDYSLFFVKRFREEFAGGNPEAAVRAATATAGKAVAISGVAVAVGLSSLTLFPSSALGSMGVGGVIVVLTTLLFALSALPALLALLGSRINWLSLHRGLRQASPTPRPSRFWRWAAETVMRHPVAIAVPTALLLLGLGTPFLSLRLSTGSSVAEIPFGPARSGYAILNQDFAQAGGVDDLNLVLLYGHDLGGRLSSLQQAQLASYQARVETVKGVEGVHGALAPPPGMSRQQYLQKLQLPPGARGDSLNSYVRGSISGPVVQAEVANHFGPDSGAGAALVERVRALPGPPGAEVLVTGGAAQSVDFLAAFARAVPYAVLMVVAVTMLVLLLSFGSLVLPVKAALMSLISISAALGAMVWIFQEGHLSNLLDFTSPGSVTATDPVLMFAILFGLSMDYEVFLLSRIREAYLRTRDNRLAVAEGLAATGGMITSAALIMVTVFGAFALGHVLDIQILGVGMAVAVTVDATLVRGIMVPALMRLLGDLNWWAPRPVQRLVARLGLYEEMPSPPSVSRGGPALATPTPAPRWPPST